jgi:hypothetical protein
MLVSFFLIPRTSIWLAGGNRLLLLDDILSIVLAAFHHFGHLLELNSQQLALLWPGFPQWSHLMADPDFGNFLLPLDFFPSSLSDISEAEEPYEVLISLFGKHLCETIGNHLPYGIPFNVEPFYADFLA